MGLLLLQALKRRNINTGDDDQQHVDLYEFDASPPGDTAQSAEDLLVCVHHRFGEQVRDHRFLSPR